MNRCFAMASLAPGLLAACLLTGCVQAPKPLYLWENFARQQYETLLRTANPGPQIQTLQAHAAKAQASGMALPPGFRAHLGLLYLSAGNLDEARSQWQSEKAVFPESTPYMDQLLKRLDAQATGKSPT